MKSLPKIVESTGRVIKTYFLITRFFVVVIIKSIACGFLVGFVFWVVGLFFHSTWWLLMLISGQPFHFSSGLLRYTVPYAIAGVLPSMIGCFINAIDAGTD